MSVHQMMTGLKTPAEVRDDVVERDRKIALLFVERGEPRGGRTRLVEEMEGKMSERDVYRAINRQLEWARAEHSRRLLQQEHEE